MRFKVGDRVKIKGLDWYNANKNKYGYVCDGVTFPFDKGMARFLGCDAIVVSAGSEYYLLNINGQIYNYFFCDYMLEGQIEYPTEESTEEPCEWCGKGKNMLESYNLNEVVIRKDSLCVDIEVESYNERHTGYVELKINFCPMCGRKLNND